MGPRRAGSPRLAHGTRQPERPDGLGGVRNRHRYRALAAELQPLPQDLAHPGTDHRRLPARHVRHRRRGSHARRRHHTRQPGHDATTRPRPPGLHRAGGRRQRARRPGSPQPRRRRDRDRLLVQLRKPVGRDGRKRSDHPRQRSTDRRQARHRDVGLRRRHHPAGAGRLHLPGQRPRHPGHAGRLPAEPAAGRVTRVDHGLRDPTGDPADRGGLRPTGPVDAARRATGHRRRPPRSDHRAGRPAHSCDRPAGPARRGDPAA